MHWQPALEQRVDKWGSARTSQDQEPGYKQEHNQDRRHPIALGLGKKVYEFAKNAGVTGHGCLAFNGLRPKALPLSVAEFGAF
jgi:hypothetical protein